MKTRILMMLAALWLGTQVAEGARETTRHTFFDLKNHRDSVERTLNEVIVKATKVKFTYKGDTLVFNANAFNMPEGSMLGSLIKQLHGVELKDNGEIYVNGRKIDNLLLNGKDFFKGDNKVILDNLSNYMVQNVEVYEKPTEKSEWLGYDVDKKEYTMDVKLKRKYTAGYTANASLGSGTEKRYKGRAFGLRFTNNSRIVAFADLNNVNESRSPGNEGEWDPTKLYTGELNLKKAGASLFIEQKDKIWQEKAQVATGFTDHTNISHSAKESFLNTGNVFQRSMEQGYNKSFQIGATNEFTWKKPFWLRSVIQIHFTNGNNHRQSQYAQFNDTPNHFGSTPQILDSVYSDFATTELINILTTRSKQQQKKGDKTYYMNLNLDFGKKLPWGDNIDLYIKTNYSRNIYNIKDLLSNDTYGKASHPVDNDFRNRYHDAHKKDFYIDSQAKYAIHSSNNWNYEGYVKFLHDYNYSDLGIFRLDRLEGWGAGSGQNIDALPSTRDSILQAIDAGNSNETTYCRMKYAPGARIFLQKESEGESEWFCIDLPFHMENRKYFYTSLVTDTLVRRSEFIPTPFVEYSRQTHNYDHRYYAKYSMSYYLPSMSHFVNVKNDIDPLNIYVSNPKLKPAIHHELVMEHNRRNRINNQNISVGMSVWFRQKSFANGYTYNTENGVRTYRTENVDGNWNAGGFLNFGRSIDKQRHWNWQTLTDFRYERNVDIAGTEEKIGNEQLNKVNNWWFKEYARLTFQWNNMKIGANGHVQFRTLNSRSQNFRSINTWDYNYGLTCEYHLPLSLELASDIKVYSRLGYGDSSMNTNDLVWNASLSRSFLKKQIMVKIEGYDLLNQLSTTYSSYNAQGRIETWYNSIPSYLMLHLAWKLNVTPRK